MNEAWLKWTQAYAAKLKSRTAQISQAESEVHFAKNKPAVPRALTRLEKLSKNGGYFAGRGDQTAHRLGRRRRKT